MNAPLEKRFTFADLQRVCKRPERGLCRRRLWQGIKWIINIFCLKKKIVRQIRKAEEVPVDKILELFIRLIEYANYRGIDVQEEISLSYPDFCIYCGLKPCGCTNPGVPRPLVRLERYQLKPDLKISVSRFQARDFEVYPNDRSYTAKLIRALHLSEEIDELVIEMLKEVIKESDLKKVTEEVIDCLERTISVASTFNIDVADLIWRYFKSGTTST